MRILKNSFITASLFALGACGGAQKTGGGGAHGVPPPPTVGAGGAEQTKPAPQRELSKDEKQDYASAMEYFKQNDKGGWNESACRSAAEKFQSVAHDHPKLVEAQFMAGLSFERCGLENDAMQAYQAATHMPGDPAKIALAVSQLGEIYYKQGKVDGAKQYWDSALKANGKLVAAHINEATLDLEKMRQIDNVKDPQWKQLDDDAQVNLSSALGVDTDNVEAYTDYGLVWMEGWRQNKNRLDLAKTLLDEAKKRNDKYAPLQNAYGLLYMHKGALNEALQAFQAAVALDPNFVEAKVNAGLVTLGFRKYDVAKDLFQKAVQLAPKDYDAIIGLGVAERGLGDLDGAEAAYKKAMALDSQRGAAYYNLGVLYKDFRATKQSDLKQSVEMYKQAREYFQQFLDKSAKDSDKTEAKNNIGDCDKTVEQIEKFIASQANQPPAPAPTPTPTPAPATPAPAAGTPPATPAPAGGAAPAGKPGGK